MIDCFYTTSNQRVAVALVTMGIPLKKDRPITVEARDVATGEGRKIVFHFEQTGSWKDFSAQSPIAIRADEIAHAYYQLGRGESPNRIPAQVAHELRIIHSCLEVRDVLNKVRKSANPETSYVGVAICENISALDYIARNTEKTRRLKIRRGTLITPESLIEENLKFFKSFT